MHVNYPSILYLIPDPEMGYFFTVQQPTEPHRVYEQVQSDLPFNPKYREIERVGELEFSFKVESSVYLELDNLGDYFIV